MAPAPGRPRRGFTEGKAECNAADIDAQYPNENQSKVYVEVQNLLLIMDLTNNETPEAERALSRLVEGIALGPLTRMAAHLSALTRSRLGSLHLLTPRWRVLRMHTALPGMTRRGWRLVGE